MGDRGWYSQTEHPLNDRTTLKVNHRSGNAYLKADDLKVPGVGLDLTVGLRYNSRAEAVGQFGPQWSLSGGPDVRLRKIDRRRYAYNASASDGAEFGPFVRNANDPANADYNKFTKPAGGVGADLLERNDGTFALTFNQSQQKSIFAPTGASGALVMTRDVDRSGNTISYDYVAGTTRLASITDTGGRTYQVDYNAGGQISGLTDTNGPGTRIWSYGYDADGRSTSYIDPAGNQTDYGWGTGIESSQPTVATITDEVNDSGQAPKTTLETYADEATDVAYAAATGAEDAPSAVQARRTPPAEPAGIDHRVAVPHCASAARRPSGPFRVARPRPLADDAAGDWPEAPPPTAAPGAVERERRATPEDRTHRPRAHPALGLDHARQDRRAGRRAARTAPGPDRRTPHLATCC